MSNISIKDNGNIKVMIFNKMLEFHDKVDLAVALKTYNNNFKVYQNGVSLYDDYDKAINKYKGIADYMNIDIKDIHIPKQMHTDNIVKVLDKNNKITDAVDGFVTNIPKIPLASTFADCIPLFFYDPIKNVIANIHSGWKGTIKKIGQKAVGLLIKDYDCKPQNIICFIGPCIRKDHFLVNEDVKGVFELTFKDYISKENIIDSTDKYNENGKQYSIDSILINKLMLKDMGVIDTNIIDSNICTVCESDNYHSYRVEGVNYELNTGIIVLK